MNKSENNLYYLYQPSEDSEYVAIEVTTADSMLNIEDRLPNTNFYCTYAENPQQAILQIEELKKDSET